MINILKIVLLWLRQLLNSTDWDNDKFAYLVRKLVKELNSEKSKISKKLFLEKIDNIKFLSSQQKTKIKKYVKSKRIITSATHLGEMVIGYYDEYVSPRNKK